MALRLDELKEGDRVRIRRRFTDYDGTVWEKGRILEFSRYTYFFYDGGFTFYFREGVMRLAYGVEENDRVLRDAGAYFAREPGAAPP